MSNDKVDIESLTIAQARETAAMFQQTPQAKLQPALSCTAAQVYYPYELGKPYLIRTVTMVDIGRLVDVTDKELVLIEAAWVADTGRFADALKSCDFNEVEPFPDGRVIINRASVIEAVQIETLKRSQK